MTYLKNIHCEVCNNEDPEKFSLKYELTKYSIVTCHNCGFVFIPQYYRKNIHYEDYRDEAVLKSVRQGNNYIKIRRHRLRLKLIQNYVKTGKLYDVGVGWGHFLYTAKLMGFDTTGVEVSALMYYYSTNDLHLNVVNDNFLNLNLPSKTWDVVTMWDVLEHIANPKEVLRRVHKMLKDDGYFVFQVPQIDSKVAKKQKEKWSSMLSIEHINYFSKKSIDKLLTQEGFEIIKIKSSFELKLFLMFTVLPWLKRRRRKNKTSNQAKISNSERQNFFNKFTRFPKFVIWLGLLAHDIIYKAMSKLNYGEEMIVIAKKKSK
ncbi:MAG: class I SAM-dependent methyltransferase [Bacteroidales bacterium]|jgi:2-polyprenyl-3-methyl-5-hydroxy-6-metoxy-1,4-benzoquinol methylase|nr:class I SAM-dependent methyltransferase [Bacteroidales bacterium]